MALKVSTHWTVAALLVRDAVGLGSGGGGGERGILVERCCGSGQSLLGVVGEGGGQTG